MSKQFTVKEFLKLTAPQKDRLYRNNRSHYDELVKAVKENYDPETDQDALKELVSNPKTKSLVKGE